MVVLNSVSRSKSLKIPRQLEIEVEKLNNIEEELAVKKSIAIASNEKFAVTKTKAQIEKRDVDLKIIDKIPSNASELMVNGSKKIMRIHKRNY